MDDTIKNLDDKSLVDLFLRVFQKGMITQNDEETNRFVNGIINHFGKDKIIELIKKFN